MSFSGRPLASVQSLVRPRREGFGVEAGAIRRRSGARIQRSGQQPIHGGVAVGLDLFHTRLIIQNDPAPISCGPLRLPASDLQA